MLVAISATANRRCSGGHRALRDGRGRPSLHCPHLELDHVMAAEAVDEVAGSAFGNDLAVIDDGEAVAEAFGFVHVVSGEQDGATFLLESADDVPELAAALGIESGGGLVEKKDAWIAY